MNENRKILVVDDEPRIRSIYERILLDAGFSVTLAANGEEALEKIIRERIDLILLDISMPQVNGKSLFEIIQEYDSSLKIIISSVYPLHVQKIMLPEALDYHDKSHGPTSLLEKIHSAV